jgi:hypothetical protein
MANILLVVGPQCAGNHLWNKIFNLHPDVVGWEELNHRYHINFIENKVNDIFIDPSTISSHDWTEDNYVLNVSWPFAKGKEPHIHRVLSALEDMGHNIQLAIIGRDENITKYSQRKRRTPYKVDDFIAFTQSLMIFEPIFISYELLFMYRSYYLQQLDRMICIPIDYNSVQLSFLLKSDSNKNYIHLSNEPTIELYNK